MRKFSLLLISLIMLAAACSKSSGIPFPKPDKMTLDGKWVFTKNFYSDGAHQLFSPANPGGQTVQLNSNGTVRGNVAFLRNLSTYSLEGSDTLHFFSNTAATANRSFFYYIDSATQELYMYPFDFSCTEGCGYVLERK